jgi:cardiolipin synthase A/B
MAHSSVKTAPRKTALVTVQRRKVGVTLVRVEKIILTCERIFLIVAICAGTGCAMKLGKQPRQEVASLYSAQSPEFRQAAGSLLGPNFVGGNSISTLVNGDEIFPAMLNAIRSARRSINLETYVFWDGEIAREFTAALSERARAGVHVNLILDAQGTRKMGIANKKQLQDAGVQIVKYHSVFWPDPRRYNNRSHRKLLIIDGRIAFIGGAGIADLWAGNADSTKHWRDNHYKVMGPVVAQLQASFVSSWIKTRGNVLHGVDYFPPLQESGSLEAAAVRSGAHYENLDLMYLLAIASAKKSLRIENAYFLPDDLTRKELLEAARRGAKIEIIVPGKKIDQKLVRAASRRHWPDLLKAGIKIYEYQPTMVHVKLMIVDDKFVSVGSGNFDNRSIRLNDEANLDVLDSDFAAQQIRLFEIDKRRSHEVNLDELGGFHIANPFEHAAGLLSPQL